MSAHVYWIRTFCTMVWKFVFLIKTLMKIPQRKLMYGCNDPTGVFKFGVLLLLLQENFSPQIVNFLNQRARGPTFSVTACRSQLLIKTCDSWHERSSHLVYIPHKDISYAHVLYSRSPNLWRIHSKISSGCLKLPIVLNPTYTMIFPT